MGSEGSMIQRKSLKLKRKEEIEDKLKTTIKLEMENGMKRQKETYSRDLKQDA